MTPLYGHPRDQGMRDQVKLAFSTPWERGIADAKKRMESA